MQKPLIRDSGPNPIATVIWLHGLGADGYDFYPIVPELKLDFSVRFIFPHAPRIPVTINAGYVMPAWYDILSVEDFGRKVDVDGISNSVALVRGLVADEISAGMPARKIFVAGFSQGGVIAYLTTLTHELRLGGVLALSTYLPEPQHWVFGTENTATPIFVAHGAADTVVPYELGSSACAFLRDKGYDVEWHSYNMQHSVSPLELRDISAWLNRQIAVL
jgi:phospholipase/carboxylesterase